MLIKYMYFPNYGTLSVVGLSPNGTLSEQDSLRGTNVCGFIMCTPGMNINNVEYRGTTISALFENMVHQGSKVQVNMRNFGITFGVNLLILLHFFSNKCVTRIYVDSFENYSFIKFTMVPIYT